LLDRWEQWLEGHRVAAGAALVLVAFAVFGGTLSNGFVYDDVPQTLHNPFISNPHLWKRILTGSTWSFAGLGGDYYRPLQEFCYWLIYRLAGADAAYFHLLQLVLYAAAIWAVYRLGRELLRSDLAAFLGALVWALHPLHVEAVAWISALPDVGAGLFYVVGFWLYLRAENSVERRWMGHVLAALAFFIALNFKEMALSFPLVLVAWAVFFPREESWLQRAVRFIPYLVVLGAYIEIRFAAVGRLAPSGKPWDLTTTVISTALGLLGRNTQLFFWPVHLTGLRGFDPAASLRSPWPWAVVLVALAALGFRKREPVLGFLIVWWPLALAPCLDYRQLSWPLVSDRFSFIPSVGLCLAVAYLVVVWLPQRTSAKAVYRYALPALGMVAVFWGAETVRAVPRWRNNQTLMKYAGRVAPDSPFVHMDKAWELQYRQHDLDGAEREFETALRLNNASFRPVFNLTYNAYLGLGHVALEKGQREVAKQYFEKAIRFWPQETFAYHSLGALYFTDGDYAHAAEIFRQAVRRNPQDLIGRFYLGTCLVKLGEYRKAAEQFHAAREVDPTYREAYEAEARALEAAGDAAGAAEVRKIMPARS
jgi:tetratricopeptide (TPR) repeat protein